MKTCHQCLSGKDLSCFSKAAANIDGLHTICKECDRVRSQAYYAKHKDRLIKKCNQYLREHKQQHKRYQRKSNLKRQFGLSIESYNKLLERQHGVCAICGEKPSIELNVDHCHKTGQVRGLLCSPCNLGLGNFKDNSNRLYKAVEYLAKCQ